MALLQKNDDESREEATQKFGKACAEAGINYVVHHDRNIAIHELLHESIFADLLVIESKETFTHYEEKLQQEMKHERLPKSTTNSRNVNI